MKRRAGGAAHRYVGYMRAGGIVNFVMWALARTCGALMRGRVVRLRARGLSAPVHVCLGSSDLHVFRQMFLALEYAPMMSRVDPFGVSSIVDCGANIGLAAAYFLSHCPRATLVAIEPDDDNVALLSKNLAPYGARTRVIRAGVWSGPVALGVREDTLGLGREWSRQLERVPSDSPGAIRAMGPSELLDSADGHVDLLKVDIEGAEVELFRSDASWLADVGAVAIELHDDTPFGPARALVTGVLDRAGFVLTTSGEFTLAVRPLVAEARQRPLTVSP